MEAIEAGADRLEGVRVHQMHVLHDRPYLHGVHGDRLRHVSYFLSHVTRPAYWAGTIDLVPNNFSEVPVIAGAAHEVHGGRGRRLAAGPARLLQPRHQRRLRRPADRAGAVLPRGHAAHAPHPRAPTPIHHSQVAGWCTSDRPLVEVPRVEARPGDRVIGELVAERIPDGATIQIGIGSIAAAVLDSLRDHKRPRRPHRAAPRRRGRPGRGGRRHRRREGGAPQPHHGHLLPRHQAAVRLARRATRRSRCCGVDFVNDPRVIARMTRFVSVNATTEVDLVGQCASETVAGRYWSSSGGQADFARGAMYAEEGKAFIVTPSTDPRRSVSRIVATLSPGSVVTTLKNTVDHVVTEHGVAELRGRQPGRAGPGPHRHRRPRPPRRPHPRRPRPRPPLVAHPPSWRSDPPAPRRI